METGEECICEHQDYAHIHYGKGSCQREGCKCKEFKSKNAGKN